METIKTCSCEAYKKIIQELERKVEVYREIAIKVVDDELTGPQSKEGIAEKFIDEEFEKRMKEKENR